MRKTLIIDFLLALTRSYYIGQEDAKGIAMVDRIIAKKAAQENVDDYMKELAETLAAEVELDIQNLKDRVNSEVDELASRTADGSGSGEGNPGDPPSGDDGGGSAHTPSD